MNVANVGERMASISAGQPIAKPGIVSVATDAMPALTPQLSSLSVTLAFRDADGEASKAEP